MKTLNYKSFAAECIEDLKLLQEKFKQSYDVDWYDNWFYNQSTGLLTFNTGEAELNFKYIDIGSFSEKSSTWKWSWDNDTTFENVKGPIYAVQEFGIASNFSKLSTGYFTSDEFEAWEFAAIAARLTNGIGIYRPVNDVRLQIFLVVTEFVDNETAKTIKDKFVECGNHEYQKRAFVCKHINQTTKTGFEEAFETSEDMEFLEDDDFQAWCNECEIVRKEEGEWTDKAMAFSDIKVVCEKCYFEMKEFNLGYR